MRRAKGSGQPLRALLRHKAACTHVHRLTTATPAYLTANWNCNCLLVPSRAHLDHLAPRARDLRGRRHASRPLRIPREGASSVAAGGPRQLLGGRPRRARGRHGAPRHAIWPGLPLPLPLLLHVERGWGPQVTGLLLGPRRAHLWGNNLEGGLRGVPPSADVVILLVHHRPSRRHGLKALDHSTSSICRRTEADAETQKLPHWNVGRR